MKNSELRKLVSQYKEIMNKQKKKYVNVVKLSEKLKDIEHRYFQIVLQHLHISFFVCL